MGTFVNTRGDITDLSFTTGGGRVRWSLKGDVLVLILFLNEFIGLSAQ